MRGIFKDGRFIYIVLVIKKNYSNYFKNVFLKCVFYGMRFFKKVIIILFFVKILFFSWRDWLFIFL